MSTMKALIYVAQMTALRDACQELYALVAAVETHRRAGEAGKYEASLLLAKDLIDPSNKLDDATYRARMIQAAALPYYFKLGDGWVEHIKLTVEGCLCRHNNMPEELPELLEQAGVAGWEGETNPAFRKAEPASVVSQALNKAAGGTLH